MELNSDKPAMHTVKEESRTYTFTVKQLLIAALCVAGLILLLFIWKSIQTNSLKRAAAADEVAIKTLAKAKLIENSKRQLKLLAKPYTWAVRTALQQANGSLVNEYANDIVKEKNVVSVMLVDTKNIIISSTNKKYEGKNYLTVGTADYLSVDSAIVKQINDSLLVLASPVMS
ncbi:MAG: hypothetical protein WKF91_14075, partial [Segetibacter sp.]